MTAVFVPTASGGEGFSGYKEGSCTPAEHRTLGGRAWCHICQEYCSYRAPCVRCEEPFKDWQIAEARWWAEQASNETQAWLTAEAFPWETP